MEKLRKYSIVRTKSNSIFIQKKSKEKFIKWVKERIIVLLNEEIEEFLLYWDDDDIGRRATNLLDNHQ